MAQHAIFRDIDLRAVQQRMLADAAVLDEWESSLYRRTPSMMAIDHGKPAIARWLIQHQGRHYLGAADEDGRTALH